MPAVAAPFSARSARSSTCKARNHARRSADDVEKTIREHWAQGIRNFFITDDNFGRNKDWEAIFDRIIEMREREKMNIRLMIQVDTLCHKIPNFIEKAVRAGTNRALIGLESINAANLMAANKRQNKITEYRKMLLAWKNAGTHHHCRLHPRFSLRHARIPSARTSRSFRTSCRSTSSNSSASPRCPVRRTTRSCTARASGCMRT